MSTITVTIPASATLKLGKKTEAEVDFARMQSAGVLAEFAVEGMRNKLGDVIAGKSGEEATEAINRKLRDLYEGRMRTARAADDELSMIRKVCTKRFRGKYAASEIARWTRGDAETYLGDDYQGVLEKVRDLLSLV